MPPPPDPVTATPTGRPVLFYTPHQDDETLFMGQVIAHHALAGREVHVVLCSNGSTSSARAEVNGDAQDTGFWGTWHYPPREGYEPLDQVEFGRARTDELVAACGQLGVPAERVHLGRGDQLLRSSADLPDNVSPQWAQDVMTSWAEYFTARGIDQVGHYTMWWNDPQPDHAALGLAMRGLRSAHPSWFGDTRWLVKPEQVGAANALPYPLPSALASQVRAMARHAGWCYRAWLPSVGAYAIGYHSVGSMYFDDVERGDPNHIVRL